LFTFNAPRSAAMVVNAAAAVARRLKWAFSLNEVAVEYG
jgi:hypothetical protein